MDKTFTMVGVSTQAKITKFRVANGDMAQRVKVLERNGHTEISMIELPTAMNKTDAIAFYKTQHPESEHIKFPNEKEAKDATSPKTPKTITIKKTGDKVTDAAIELLNKVEEES